MAKHWIAGNGSVGCLYDGCEVFSTKRDAIGYLADLFSEVRGVKTALQRYEIFYFPSVDKWSGCTGVGADYCEISPCYCNDMSVHSDGL